MQKIEKSIENNLLILGILAKIMIGPAELVHGDWSSNNTTFIFSAKTCRKMIQKLHRCPFTLHLKLMRECLFRSSFRRKLSLELL
jgi:hypothetical protein